MDRPRNVTCSWPANNPHRQQQPVSLPAFVRRIQTITFEHPAHLTVWWTNRLVLTIVFP